MQIADGLENEPKLLAEIADTLRVGETRFFRDPAQWHALKALVLPTLNVERVRALSVGCSTGEEAYTLGMVLDQEANLFEDGFRVVGMDRSEAALSVQRAARCIRQRAASVIFQPLYKRDIWLLQAPTRSVLRRVCGLR